MRDPRSFPSWLPPLVREHAHALRAEMLKSGTGEVAVLERLTSDSRMEAVWKYLQKRRRVGYRRTGYEHAPRDPMAHTGVNRSSFATRADWLQQLAMKELYTVIIAWGRGFAAPSSPRYFYHADAARLRAEVRFLENEPFGLSAATKRRLASLLRRTADAYESAAQEARAKTIEELPRYVAMVITQRLYELFGERMYGQAATVVSVIMQRDISVAMVREAVVALWGNSRKKQR